METDSGASAPDEVELVLMWTCPSCHTGLDLHDRLHACGDWTVDGILERRPDDGVALYHALAERLLALPDTEVFAAPGRIRFGERTAFANVEKVGNGFLDVTFALRRADDHPLVRRIFREEEDLKGHTVRVATQADVDALMPLLREARALQAEAPKG